MKKRKERKMWKTSTTSQVLEKVREWKKEEKSLSLSLRKQSSCRSRLRDCLETLARSDSTLHSAKLLRGGRRPIAKWKRESLGEEFASKEVKVHRHTMSDVHRHSARGPVVDWWRTGLWTSRPSLATTGLAPLALEAARRRRGFR